MPDKETIKRAKQDKAEGKSASTQAGEFVREEIHHIREGKHGARSTKQAIAIGLSKARRAGVDLPPPKKGKVTDKSRKSAERAYEQGQEAPNRKPSRTRSRSTEQALQREGTQSASGAALSRQAKATARNRMAEERSQAAMKAVRTKGKTGLSRAARKAARTRAAHA